MLISDSGYKSDMSQQRSDLKHAINEPRKSEGQKFMRYFTLAPNTNSLQNPIVSDISFPIFFFTPKNDQQQHPPLNSIILRYQIILHLRCVFCQIGKGVSPSWFHPSPRRRRKFIFIQFFELSNQEVGSWWSLVIGRILGVAGCWLWLLVVDFWSWKGGLQCGWHGKTHVKMIKNGGIEGQWEMIFKKTPIWFFDSLHYTGPRMLVKLRYKTNFMCPIPKRLRKKTCLITSQRWQTWT